MQEIWKDIKGYEGYQVSNLGRIRTHNKTTYTKRHGIRKWEDRILHLKPSTISRQNIKQGGGYRISLWKDGKCKDFLVARLVATTFLEDLIDTDMTVNHKDGNRLNNCADNLEWLSRSDNIKYGFENGQYKQHKTILYNDKERYEFRSKSLAGQFLGKNCGYICRCIKKNKKAISVDGIEYNIQIIM